MTCHVCPAGTRQISDSYVGESCSPNSGPRLAGAQQKASKLQAQRVLSEQRRQRLDSDENSVDGLYEHITSLKTSTVECAAGADGQAMISCDFMDPRGERYSECVDPETEPYSCGRCGNDCTSLPGTAASECREGAWDTDRRSFAQVNASHSAVHLATIFAVIRVHLCTDPLGTTT